MGSSMSSVTVRAAPFPKVQTRLSTTPVRRGAKLACRGAQEVVSPSNSMVGGGGTSSTSWAKLSVHPKLSKVAVTVCTPHASSGQVTVPSLGS